MATIDIGDLSSEERLRLLERLWESLSATPDAVPLPNAQREAGSGIEAREEASEPAMSPEERRKRPEHHIVHDYANLVSSGRLITDRKTNDALLKLAPVNSHVWHAFYMNCRKMYEFFGYARSKKYLRAQHFARPGVTFSFRHWTGAVQNHMNVHLLHVGGGRVSGNTSWTGSGDKLYLADFESAWATLMGNLKGQHKQIFKEEIEHRLDSEFRHCGTLGKELIV